MIKNTERNFKIRVDEWVLGLIRRGVTSFNRLIYSLPGVYPPTVLHSLQRLVSCGEIPSWILSQARKQIRVAESAHPTFAHDMILPPPHPLDYDWRFSSSAHRLLLNECLKVTRPGHSVVLLGTPSLLWAAHRYHYPRHFLLLDANKTIITSLTRAISKDEVVECDVSRDQLPAFSASAAIIDPPWYGEHIRAFLWAACQMCKPGAYLFLSMPPLGTRPNVDTEWSNTLVWAKQIGVDFVRSDFAALSYVSPYFEQNALRAEGFLSVPTDWRRGDLAIFRRRGKSTVPRPIIMSQDGEWDEEILFGVRVRIRRQSLSGFEDPSLISVVEGDILSSVSRRDQRRTFADVWTSGNRIFACKGCHILRRIVQAMITNHSPQEAVANSLNRQLSPSEVRLVSHAIYQIKEIIRGERSEGLFFGEGLYHAERTISSSG